MVTDRPPSGRPESHPIHGRESDYCLADKNPPGARRGPEKVSYINAEEDLECRRASAGGLRGLDSPKSAIRNTLENQHNPRCVLSDREPGADDANIYLLQMIALSELVSAFSLNDFMNSGSSNMELFLNQEKKQSPKCTPGTTRSATSLISPLTRPLSLLPKIPGKNMTASGRQKGMCVLGASSKVLFKSMRHGGAKDGLP